MTKIIAFSGNSNTGKTSAINYLKDHYGTLHPELKIHLLGETAREYIELHNWVVDDVHAFEEYIIAREQERLAELKSIKENNTYDLVFIDRTSLDAIIYSYRNLINGDLHRIDYVQDYDPILKLSKSLYDNVVFFTTPIKVDSRFPIYNNEHINAIFEHSIRYYYDPKVIVYTNNIFFQDNIQQTIFGNLFDL